MPKKSKIYKWAPGSNFKVEAQVAGEYIDGLQKQHGGYVTSEQVWKAAKDPSSPIHGEFQWDEKAAAEAYWKHQARNLVNHIVTVPTKTYDAAYGVRAFPSDIVAVEKDVEERAYVPGEDINSIEEHLESRLEQALHRLELVMNTYLDVSALNPVWNGIKKARKKLIEKQQVN